MDRYSNFRLSNPWFDGLSIVSFSQEMNTENSTINKMERIGFISFQILEEVEMRIPNKPMPVKIVAKFVQAMHDC